MSLDICIIGTGNVSWHLQKAFLAAGHNVIAVSSRLPALIPPNSDFYIIAVSDDAIPSVAASLPPFKGILLHTSGSVSIDALAPHSPRGVFYPLQTFTKGVELNYALIPFFIEASDDDALSRLSALVASIDAEAYPLSSVNRRKLHLAAVVSSNFSNALYTLADEQLNTFGLSFSCLKPLLSETLRKAAATSPLEAQTGPARRGDYATIDSHLKELADNQDAAEIYRTLTSLILRQQGNSPIR